MALVSDPVSAVSDLAKTVIGTIWPDKSVQEQAQLAAALALVQGQLDVNKVEAASPNVWTSGWRPYIGWVCGTGCAWNWIGLPALSFLLAALGHPMMMKAADMGEMMPLLLGMLGIGGLRTIEKIKGVA